ncbi:MAG: sigma-70 family RNA polymerase sigma factor [Lachnospiraceae bacterium]|nr:sigma-70 family RNA polymerase sigma factor [Lachnospiraceae bacterium]
MFLFVIYMTGQLNVLLKKEVFILNDKKIISAIINRDEQMLAFVVQKYSKLLWKIAAPILINAASVQDVEECVADVFIHLWQCPEKYDSDKGRLSAWLSMVARSKAIDRYRQIVRKRELPIEEIVAESPVYAEIATADAENERLLSCIGELDENEKELIIRRYYYEQKPAEIAVVLDIPKKQVENKLYYVRQKLKKMMENQEGELSYEKI